MPIVPKPTPTPAAAAIDRLLVERAYELLLEGKNIGQLIFLLTLEGWPQPDEARLVFDLIEYGAQRQRAIDGKRAATARRAS